ncbi:MAG: PepSY domain-containing protein [Nitrospirales bacterium]|nr:PepSY domain-containing protein [Nitrospira sp.]MDR4502757.1 PepSY domain-containing protein [Nitrospirales bacterium]
MKRFSYMMCVVIVGVVLLTCGLAISSEGTPQQGTTVSTAALSMEEAITAAKAKFPGKVLEAEFEHEDGKAVFEIEIASNTGGVTEIKIDAQSGEVLSSEKEEQNEHETEQSEQNDDD